jgi:PAS domain S-box-containing protein
VFVNRYYADALRLTREACYGRTDFELLPHEIAEALRASEAAVLESGRIMVSEEAVPQADGVHTFLSYRFPVRAPDGTITGLGGIAADISRLKHVEATLRKSEARLLAMFDGLPVLIDAFDASGNIIGWNAECERVTGYTAAEIIGNPQAMELLYPDPHYRRTMLEEAEQLKHQKYSRTFELVAKDGTTRTIQWFNVGERFPVPGWAEWSVGVDMTEGRRLEAALRQAQKMEAIGSLSGAIAHDFNNLLGIMVGNLELAQALLPEMSEAHELLGEALDAARRGAELTQRLLAFARRQPLRPVVVWPNELIARISRLLQRLLGEDVRVHLDLARDTWPVMVDPVQLEASLTNLATNSRDAMPGGGTLTISTLNRSIIAGGAADDPRPGDYVLIEVADSGSGMDAELMRRIFEPFFTTKEHGKGTGLGLSIVFGFAKQSGGHVSAESRPGAGTTFRLLLPRTTIAAEAVPDFIPPTVAHGRGETILVAEDNARLRAVTVRQLKSLGYRVLEAANASIALDALAAQRVQLLFSDVVMPGGIDGFALAREALERWPGTRVLLTSGFPGSASFRADTARGVALSLLDKPYGIETLARAVRDALDKPPR